MIIESPDTSIRKNNDKSESGNKLLNAIESALKEINTDNNVRYINPKNYDKLGKFHKQLISNFGMMLNLVDKNQEVDYSDFVQVFEKLFEKKTDIEKQYLW